MRSEVHYKLIYHAFLGKNTPPKIFCIYIYMKCFSYKQAAFLESYCLRHLYISKDLIQKKKLFSPCGLASIVKDVEYNSLA